MSGQFTIGQPDPATGKGNLIFVKCDLCGEQSTFDPQKVYTVEDGIQTEISQHVCKKPDRKKPKKKFSLLKQIFGEYTFGDRKHRLGREIDEQEEV